MPLTLYLMAIPQALLGTASPVSRVLAVVRLGKDRRLTLFPPQFFAGTSGGLPEVIVPFGEIPIDRRLSLVHRFVVTVVDNRARHATEDGLDYIQELSAGRQWCSLD